MVKNQGLTHNRPRMRFYQDQHFGELRIGTADSGGMIRIPYKDRAAQLHIMGRTRSGKTRFEADLIQQDIAYNKGVGLIDHHGELYDLTMSWLIRNKTIANRRTIHAVDFSDPHLTFRYNPLHIDHPEEAFGVASNVANALTRIYGGSRPEDTPLIKATLDMVCVILAERGLPLAAAEYFLISGHYHIRERIVQGVQDPYYRALGQELLDLPPREFRETVASTERRIRNFIGNPHVRRMFSTTENTASLREIMDEGHILLLNTRKKNRLVDFNELRALGMLYTNNLFASAFDRDPEKDPRPFYLYIDECQNYVSDDIENILSQASKFGLFLALSHQQLGHLVQAGEHIYKGVMSGTLLKVIFQITFEEALVFADELFADEIDFEKTKQNVRTPHMIGHQPVVTPSWSVTTGTNETDAESQGEANTIGEADTHAKSFGTSDSYSTSTTTGTSGAEISGTVMSSGSSAYIPDELFADSAGHTDFSGVSEISSIVDGWSESTTESESHSKIEVDTDSKTLSMSNTKSKATAKAKGSSWANTTGYSTTFIPLIEMMATQTYTLEEQRYDLARRIARQPKRHAYLCLLGEGTVGFKTRDVEDVLQLPLGKERLMRQIVDKSQWLIPSVDLKPMVLPSALANECIEVRMLVEVSSDGSDDDPFLQ